MVPAIKYQFYVLSGQDKLLKATLFTSDRKKYIKKTHMLLFCLTEDFCREKLKDSIELNFMLGTLQGFLNNTYEKNII